MKGNSKKAENLAKFVRDNPGVLQRQVIVQAMRIDYVENLQKTGKSCQAYEQTAERFGVDSITVRRRLKS